ncbi:MAG: beta/gamma crystallin-related protein [Chitinophagales bacterium]
MKRGVDIYDFHNLQKRLNTFNEGEYSDLRKSKGLNDTIDSIRVQEGYYAHFYEHPNFSGKRLVLFKGSYKRLPEWNAKISSIKVFKHDDKLFPAIQFYEDPNFKGQVQNIAGAGKDTKYNFPFFRDNRISSMIVPEGVKVVLFKDKGFKGKSREFSAGKYTNFDFFGLNDSITSIIIKKPNLEIIKVEYKGESSLPNGDPIAMSSSLRNETDILQSVALTLNRKVTNSSKHNWQNSTLIGISVSVSASVGVTGPISSEVSTTINSTLENTFTIGGEKSKSESIGFSKTVNVNVSPQSTGTVIMQLIPKKSKIKVAYTFKIKGSERRITENAEILVENYHEGNVIIRSTKN